MLNDVFSLVLKEIPRLFQQSASPLEGMGMDLYRVFSGIGIIWFAMGVALTKSFDSNRFLSLVMVIVITGTILTGYSQPIPGFGISFRSLITDQAYDMAQLIDKDHVQRVHERLNTVETQLEPPGMFEVSASIRYYLVLLLLAVAQAATVFIVSYGYLAGAMAGLTGPFFIPFLLMPGMDWLFWGWLKSYIQFSFYPVFAYAYTSLLGMMLIHFLDQQLPSGTSLATMFVPLLMLLMVYIYGLLKLPTVVGALFSGRSGEAAGPGL